MIDANEAFYYGESISVGRLSNGFPVLEVENRVASATVSLYGGQILTWQPKHHLHPVLWVSQSVQFRHRKAIRAGVPICWPWFGAHWSDQNLPAHGYARLSLWEPCSVTTLPCGATVLTLVLQSDEVSQEYFSSNIRLELELTIGETLKVVLNTFNGSTESISLTEGFHTYFKISDISNVTVTGLEKQQYVDLADNNKIATQGDPIRFEGHVGRIFKDSQNACFINDHDWGRQIQIYKKGSNSTAVWNPGLDVAATMDDLGVDSWRDMLCVESVNTADDLVQVSPGEHHKLESSYSVSSLDYVSK